MDVRWIVIKRIMEVLIRKMIANERPRILSLLRIKVLTVKVQDQAAG